MSWSTIQRQTYERAGWSCEYCGLDFLASTHNYQSAQVHHVVPSGSGGTSTFENTASVCSRCHGYLKGAGVPEGATREEKIAFHKDHIPKMAAHYMRDIEKLRSARAMKGA